MWDIKENMSGWPDAVTLGTRKDWAQIPSHKLLTVTLRKLNLIPMGLKFSHLKKWR